jgi:type IV secretion system protein VirB10
MYMVNAQLQQRVQLDCGTDDAWHALPKTAEEVPNMTPEQRAAFLAAQRGGGGGRRAGGNAPTRQDRLNAALASSSVVDFSEPPTTPVAAVQSPAIPSMPSIPGAPGAVPGADTQLAADQKKGYPWDSFTGPLYHVFGGPRFIDCILMNRMQGEFTGPVVVMVRTAVYSWDRQHVLIPRGSLISGISSKVSTNGQRRLAVDFDRLIMPDGYAVPLKDFIGLDQQGAAGLTGQVNTHWPKIIGTAALVGAIGGLSQIGGVSNTNAWSNMRAGVGSQTGQEATQILQQTYNTLPTVTVYEGTLVNVWVLQDLTLPAVENHTVSPSL